MNKKIMKNNSSKKKIIGILLFLVIVVSCSLSYFCFSSQDFDAFANSFKDATNYYINGELDANSKTLTCTQKVEYKNATRNSLNCLEFHLYPNNFTSSSVNKPVSSLYESSAYPNGKSYGYITINSIKSGNDNLVFSYKGTDNDILKVDLPSVLNNNSCFVLSIDYVIKIPNVNHRFGYGENTINLGNFYPIACVFENGEFVEDYYTTAGDPFYSDMANYYVEMKYPVSFVMASSGNVMEEISDSTTKTTKVEGKGIRDFAMVFSDKFKVLSQEVGNTSINYYYHSDKNSEKSLNTCVDSLTTFNSFIGEYAYRTLNVVESNFVYGGMEYPNLVLISDSLEKYEDYTNTIIHEIGHQWFYGMVGNNEYNYGWLDEGLTEYITNCFYKQNPQYNVVYDEVISNAESAYGLFVQIYTSVYGDVDTSMNRRLNEYTTEPEYVYMAYVKGMLLFDNLQTILGEKTFNKALQTYFREYKGKNATPNDIIRVFEKCSHKNLKSFFSSWIDGKVAVIPID